MVINMRQPIIDVFGEPVPDEKTGKPSELRTALVIALGAQYNHERGAVDEVELAKRFHLQMKILESDNVDFTVEELATVKKLMRYFFPSPSVWGPLCEYTLEAKEFRPPGKKNTVSIPAGVGG